jgi:biotin carboxyl carrier protein
MDENYTFASIKDSGSFMLKAEINAEKVFEIINPSSATPLVDGENIPFEIISSSRYEILVRNKQAQFRVLVLSQDHKLKRYVLKINGRKYMVQLQDRLDLLLAKMGINSTTSSEIRQVKAPMPGLILDINATTGTDVKKGDKLLVLEAMKMENIIKSPVDGKVKDVKVALGESVNKNQLLVEFE